MNKYFLEDLSTIGYFIPLGSGGQGKKAATSAKELEKMKLKHFSTDEETLSSKIIDTEPVKGIRLLTLKSELCYFVFFARRSSVEACCQCSRRSFVVVVVVTSYLA